MIHLYNKYIILLIAFVIFLNEIEFQTLISKKLNMIIIKKNNDYMLRKKY